MKKKTIIILTILIGVAVIGIILFSLLDDKESTKILECLKEETDGTKTAKISYEYFIDEDEILKINSDTVLKFLNKEEADKYEKIVSIAFFKDDIIRENNVITIKSDKQDTENKLTLEEIKKQQEEKGLECNYK